MRHLLGRTVELLRFLLGAFWRLFLPVFGMAVASASPGDWLRHGELVSTVYPIEDTGLQGPLCFVVMSKEGFLVAGGGNGAYVFDGSRWTKVSGITRACFCARDGAGDLLISSGGAISRLVLNAQGRFECVPVMQYAGLEVLTESFVELPDRRFMALYGRGMAVQQLNGPPINYLLGAWAIGLTRIEAGVFVTINNEEYDFCQVDPDTGRTRDVEAEFRAVLGPMHIVSVLNRDERSCWLVTLDGHTFLFDGKQMLPAPWQRNGEAPRGIPTCIFRLQDGSYAVGTKDLGVLFYSEDGACLGSFDRRNGLPEMSVVSLCLDRDDGLWIACSRSITCVDSRRRFTEFGESQGLKVQECELITRHQGKLYVSGREGLFVQNLQAADAHDAFRKVEGILTARGLVSDGEVLWVGGHHLIGLFPDGSLQGYETGAITGIVLAGDGGERVVCSTTTGFAVLERGKGGWRVLGKRFLDGVTTFGITEVRNGEYWANCGTGLVARLRVRGGEMDVRVFGAKEGVPDCWTDLCLFEGNLYVGASLGDCRRFDRDTETFVPCVDLEYYDRDKVNIFHPVFIDRSGRSWICGNLRNASVCGHPSRLVTTPLQRSAHGEAYLGAGLYQDEDRSLWICHTGGVLRCEALPEPVPDGRRRLMVRSIENMVTGRTLAGMIADDRRLEVGPGDNFLRISACFLDFRSCNYTRYRIWLEGFEPKPEGWGLSAERELTNLPSGSYTLHVEGKDGSGIQQQSLRLTLSVATPWYRTRPALVAYGVAALLGLVLLVRIRELRLRWNNRQLAEAVTLGRREIQRKHDELQALAHDLASMNEALLRGGQEKTEFVRALSHEIRNPIAGASIMSEALCRAQLEPQAARQASNLRACIGYLQNLLDETLDLTQIEAGRVAVRLEHFEPEALVRGTALIFEPLAAEKGLRFDCDTSCVAGLRLYGDVTHTKRILINYLSNACKFTTQGGIQLGVRPLFVEEEICRLRFEVSDSGPGISPEVRKRLFSEFVRESARSEGQAKPGAGLGLALCRRLAELADGSVGFSSAPGMGSLFWVELPFIQVTGAADQATPGDCPRADFSELAACIVDDDPLQLEALSSLLEQFGIVPARVASSREALDLLQVRNFDLVLMDYNLGGDTGIQVLQQLRRFRACAPGCSFHLVTALWDERLAAQAKEAGFASSHRKPLSSVQLFSLLRDARASKGGRVA